MGYQIGRDQIGMGAPSAPLPADIILRSSSSLQSGSSGPARPEHSTHQAESEHRLARLHKALLKTARLLEHDHAFAPVFARLEQEIAAEKASQQDDILIRARAILHQNEMGASNRLTC